MIGQTPEPRRIVLSAGTLGWLVSAAEAAERRTVAPRMGQTAAGIEAMADRARAAEARRDALWTRLKDAERKESYYGELSRKDADFSGTRDSYRRLRADTQKLFDAAQSAYDSALGGYLLLVHESERARAPRAAPARPATSTAPGRTQGAAWPKSHVDQHDAFERRAPYAWSARWGAAAPFAWTPGFPFVFGS